MAPSHTELFKRNATYVVTHEPIPTIAQIQAGGTPPPKTCIITCVDPRILPEKILGLRFGEAFIFRTIAGHPQLVFHDVVTLDAVSHGFEDIVLLYHTDCGAHLFDKQYIRAELAKVDASGLEELEERSFGAISTGIEQALREDVAWMKSQTLLRKGLEQCISGFVFDLTSGEVKRVV